MPVNSASWWRRRPWLAGALALVVVGALVAGAVAVWQKLVAPDLECGPGMGANASATACIGIDLAGERISPAQPDRVTGLIEQVKRNNDAVTDGNYVSIVLLLNLSPVAGVDTTSYDGVTRSVEGAITAVWQANHTLVYGGDQLPGAKVKLFLANMGSRNADWAAAVDRIAANAAANHVTSVVGLGQSTEYTRWATRELTVTHQLPVIGATVTGDSMNTDIADHTRLHGFFRVSPTNTDTVSAAAKYVTDQGVAAKDVAIVEDTVPGDDYTSTLVAAAGAKFPGAHHFPFTSPGLNTGTHERAASLRGAFASMALKLCVAKAKVVYFAGRGIDVGTFVRAVDEANTDCPDQQLIVLTGDDGIQAVRDTDVAAVVGRPSAKIHVRYTALASPGRWGPCTTPGREAYDQFQAAFTVAPSCGTDAAPYDGAARLRYPEKDLDNGQAILTHDAVALAVVTATNTGPSALNDPISQITSLQGTQCITAFHGASGKIQFSTDPAYHGNPIGAVLPILEIVKGETASTIDLGGPVEGPPLAAEC